MGASGDDEAAGEESSEESAGGAAGDLFSTLGRDSAPSPITAGGPDGSVYGGGGGYGGAPGGGGGGMPPEGYSVGYTTPGQTYQGSGTGGPGQPAGPNT
jgi:hypothetical protein